MGWIVKKLAPTLQEHVNTPFLGGLLETLDGLLKVSGLVHVIFVHHEMF